MRWRMTCVFACALTIGLSTLAWGQNYPRRLGNEYQRPEFLDQPGSFLERGETQFASSSFDPPQPMEGGPKLDKPAEAKGEKPAAEKPKKEEKPKEEKPKTAAEKKADALKMSASWKHGVEIQSADKCFRLHVGGRTQFDTVFLGGPPASVIGAGGAGLQDSVNFRRARLRADGVMYEVIEWAAEYDFVNSVNDDPTVAATENNVVHVPAPTDLWFTFHEMPVIGNLRVGNFKEPIGLEHLTSSRYLDFMERSYNQDAFTGAFNNGFTPGIMAYNWTEDEYATWAIGGFKNTTNVFAYNVGDGEYAATGRLTWLPFYDDASHGRYLFHLGVSGSHRDNDQNRLRMRSRASLRNGPGPLNPNIGDTGFFNSDTQSLAGAEAALVYGPLLLQAEYIGSWAHNSIGNGSGAAAGTPLGDVFFNGYYVEALYFLTGEHREYERKQGVFTRVVPYQNAYLRRTCRGWYFCRGAWQVGARYSRLDLRDSGIDGGVIQDITVGLNWFLNPNMKVQFNYVWTHRDARDSLAGAGGPIHGFGMRLAHDF